MRSRVLGLAIAAGLLAGLALPVLAAEPKAGTIDLIQNSLSWQGKEMNYPLPWTPELCPPHQEPEFPQCDHFILHVDVDPAYWDGTRSGLAEIRIDWADADNNFDLFVYEYTPPASEDEEGEAGALIKSSANTKTNAEAVTLENPGGYYDVRVVANGVTTSAYAGSAQLFETPTGGDIGGGGDPLSYVYDIDKKSYFWKKQRVQTVVVGPVGQNVRIPPPNRADTLPVSVEQGQPEKTSSLFLDLSARGVPVGATLTDLTVTFLEGSPADGAEQPTAPPNPEGKVIQACRISGYWVNSDTGAELWELTPPSEQICVQGTRDDSVATAPTWSFNLTSLASTWALDPATNNGVLFVGATTSDPADTWQVNLKIPQADNPNTPIPEYENTKSRTSVSVTFTSPTTSPSPTVSDSPSPTFSESPPPPTTPPYTPPPTTSTGATTFPGSPGTTIPGTGTAATTTTTTGTGTGLPVIPGTTTTGLPASPAGAAPATGPQTPIGALPKLPAYVWLIIPIGLLAAALARSALYERAGGPRPDGVIASIRARNAAVAGGAGAAAGVGEAIGPTPAQAPLGAGARAVKGAARAIRSLGK